MNPQYLPPQFVATSNFQANKPSPSLGGPPSTQSFQNVPLAGSEPGKMDSSNLKAGPFPPSTVGSQIPSSQLPPSQGQDLSLNNPFNSTSRGAQNGASGNFFSLSRINVKTALII